MGIHYQQSVCPLMLEHTPEVPAPLHLSLAGSLIASLSSPASLLSPVSLTSFGKTLQSGTFFKVSASSSSTRHAETNRRMFYQAEPRRCVRGAQPS